MLEELGLGEAVSQADADVIVFNTCTIREKPDQRFAAHLGNAKALKLADPEKVIAVGGCYAEAQRERLFDLYPFVDVAFGPGTIPHLGRVARRRRRGAARSVRDRRGARVRRHAAHAPRAPLPGLGAGLDGLQLGVLVLHRPGRARARGQPPARRDPRRGDATRRARASARSRCSGRTSTRTAVTCAGHRTVRRAAARGRRGRRHRADPLHEPAPEGLPPRGDRRDGRVRRGLRARAPAAPVRLDPRPEGDAAHVRPRALPAPRRATCVLRSRISR